MVRIKHLRDTQRQSLHQRATSNHVSAHKVKQTVAPFQQAARSWHTPMGIFSLLNLATAGALGGLNAPSAPPLPALSSTLPADGLHRSFQRHPVGLLPKLELSLDPQSDRLLARKSATNQVPLSRSARVLAAVQVGAIDGFVQTQGTDFVLNGSPFYFAGTNAFYAAQVDRFSDDDVRSMMADQAGRGVQVMRFFCFSNGDGADNVPTPIPIQPSIGVFQEQALQRVDLVLAEAGKNGIRVVMPLVNFEPTFGGMQWYVDSLLGSGKDKELFYTDASVKQAYKNYVSMLVGRTNSITGLVYRDDPTILAWELSNEAHTTDLYETRRNMVPGALVYNWLSEMSQFVKGLGIQQLVSTGEEGYRADGDTTCCHNSWLNGGFKGVDFVRNIQLPTIDFATVHVYPDNWGFEPDDYGWVVANFIADRAAISHNASKPIYMEEYGMTEGFLTDRATLLQTLTDGAAANAYGGTTVWQVWSQNISENGYDFDYSQSGGNAMLMQYARMREQTAAAAANN